MTSIQSELDIHHPAVTKSTLCERYPRPAVFSIRTKKLHPEGSYSERLRERLRVARLDESKSSEPNKT